MSQKPEDDPNYALTLKGSVIRIIWLAINKAPLPREMTDQVVIAIEGQVNQQNKARAEQAAVVDNAASDAPRPARAARKKR